jgi:hypothetical protein
LKLPAKNENDFKKERKIKQTNSKNINMNFGLEKCQAYVSKESPKQNAYRRHIL